MEGRPGQRSSQSPWTETVETHRFLKRHLWASPEFSTEKSFERNRHWCHQNKATFFPLPVTSPFPSGQDWWRCQNLCGWRCGLSGESHPGRSSHSLCWPSERAAVRASNYSLKCNIMRSVASPLRYFSPPVEVGLGEVHHEQGHLKRCQHQQHLGGESKDIKTI